MLCIVCMMFRLQCLHDLWMFCQQGAASETNQLDIKSMLGLPPWGLKLLLEVQPGMRWLLLY